MNSIQRKIHQIDASGQVVGRLATKVATFLRGKNKASFQPYIDAGDFVEVTNCSLMKFTGKKLDQKEYIWHTNHPGGLKRRKIKDVMNSKPGEVLKQAVFGMLPKNKIRPLMMKRLKVK